MALCNKQRWINHNCLPFSCSSFGILYLMQEIKVLREIKINKHSNFILSTE